MTSVVSTSSSHRYGLAATIGLECREAAGGGPAVRLPNRANLLHVPDGAGRAEPEDDRQDPVAADQEQQREHDQDRGDGVGDAAHLRPLSRSTARSHALVSPSSATDVIPDGPGHRNSLRPLATET